MRQIFDLSFSPKQAADNEFIKQQIASKLGITDFSSIEIHFIKKSIDARKSNIKVNLRCEAFVDEVSTQLSNHTEKLNSVKNSTPVLIVGAGPAGLFSALKLIELGFKPIIIERGKEVCSRKKDIAQINRNEGINNESNYCFGEGGAGTFSDGKLYTRSKKRGNIQEVLELLVEHGADISILYEAHPHIGTDKLPTVIEIWR